MRCLEQRLYSIDSPCHVTFNLMPPNADYFPPLPAKTPGVVLVALSSPLYLFLPVIGELVLPLRKPPSVPEIAVHKDDDPSLRKDKVRLAKYEQAVSTISPSMSLESSG